MKSPSISIILLTCNRSELIRRSIDSVLMQDYPSFELLIFDASSNEDTNNVVSTYDNERIKYFRIIDEEYIAKTLIYALSVVRGEYIAFIDDDDEWISSQKLRKQIELFNSLPSDYGIVYCWWEIVFDDTGQQQRFEHKIARGYIFDQMLEKNVINGLPSLMIKKRLFDEIEAIVDSPDILPSDHLMLTKLCKFYKVDFVPEVLVRCHERHGYGSMNNTPTDRFSERSRLNLFLCFLSSFRLDYDKNPQAKKVVFEKIITYAVKANDPKIFLSHLQKYLVNYRDGVFALKAVSKYLLRVMYTTE